MEYFKTLPKLLVTGNHTSQIVTNILARASIISSLINDPLLFYEYDIKDTDTPEIIAHKYYESVERFWIVLISNQILDPQWDWPMSNRVFDSYINNKYSLTEQSMVHHFEKVITQTHANSLIITTQSITIDEDTYNDLLESSNTFNTITGPVTIQITKKIVDNYTYEYQLNESKRNIKLLNKTYVTKIESELFKLMST
jgi:hypothetical protein